MEVHKVKILLMINLMEVLKMAGPFYCKQSHPWSGKSFFVLREEQKSGLLA